MRRMILVAVGATLLVVAVLIVVSRSGAKAATALPPPAPDEDNRTATREVAVLAAGCFWGVQGVFQHAAGVTSTVSG